MSFLKDARMGDFKRSCLLQIVAIAITIPVVVIFLFIPLWYARNGGLSPTQQNLVYYSIPVVFAIFLFTTISSVFLFVRWRRKRWLDAIFTPLGLDASSYLLHFRQYHGQIQNRRTAIYFHRGPTLEFFVQTKLSTRFLAHNIKNAPFNLRASKVQALTLPDTDWNNLWAGSLDTTWGAALLNHPQAQPILLRLLTQPTSALLRTIEWQPGAVMLRFYRNRNLYRYEISVQEVHDCVNDLIKLCQIAESLNAPQVNDQSSDLEKYTQFERDRFNRKMALISCGCLMVFLIMLGIFVALVVLK